MQVLERLGARAARDGLGAGLPEFGLQVVQEQRVYHLVDVLGAGEVLAVGPPVVVGQRPLEDRPEHGGAHTGPVELLAAVDHERGAERVGERRYLGALAEQPAIHVGQLLQPRLGVGVALRLGGVQPREQVLQCPAQVGRLVVLYVVAERVRLGQPRVLAEHQEHQARHQYR